MGRPRDDSGRFISEYRDVKCFEITVWNTMNGDIERKLWEASQADVDEIYRDYEDEPFIEIQVEERP